MASMSALKVSFSDALPVPQKPSSSPNAAKPRSHTTQQAGWVSWLSKNSKIIFLFTASDFKTIVIPKTFFGLASSLAGDVLLEGTVPSTKSIFLRTPLVMLWIWTNLLPFAIDNQRQPLSILEDKVNKPWRPMPSGSISPAHAKRLMFGCYVVAFLVSVALGALPSCLALMVLGYLYNDMGGADYSSISKNIINAGGYISFASGATAVASSTATLSNTAITWFAMIAMIVFTTVQMQDIPDQEGDKSRGRLTIPLVIGDRNARRTVAVGVISWSLAAPYFWGLHPLACLTPWILGQIVSERALRRSTVPEDKWTFKVWNVWMVSIYLLPLIKRLTESREP